MGVASLVSNHLLATTVLGPQIAPDPQVATIQGFFSTDTRLSQTKMSVLTMALELSTLANHYICDTAYHAGRAQKAFDEAEDYRQRGRPLLLKAVPFLDLLNLSQMLSVHKLGIFLFHMEPTLVGLALKYRVTSLEFVETP